MEADKKDYDKIYSVVAQLVEPSPFKREDVGSWPTGRT